MLVVPPKLAADPKFEAALDLCYEAMLTSQEVARHLRITPEHLRVLRHQGRGPAYLKFANRGVLYRMSEVLRYCYEAEARGKEKRRGRRT